MEKENNEMISGIIQVDKALESWRDAGFDLPAAVGEPVDNSIEAKAHFIKIDTGNGGSTKSIEKIAFADDGIGIEPSNLAKTLKLGYSGRYNQRTGLGRFGVGLKLAALSQSRRIDIYTKPLNSNKYFQTFLDLNLVINQKQNDIRAIEVDGWPKEYEHLMQESSGKPFESGTLVVWSNVDRLVEGGKYGTSIQEKLQDLTKFLARAYRKFIDQGLRIELDGKAISLHDPLFLLENQRVTKVLGEESHAEIIDSNTIKIDNHEVEIVVSLLPEKVRLRRGEGGRGGKGDPFKDLYIPDNQGRISILRNGREIYYDVIPRILPGGIHEKDRFIGIQVSFPATLDEFFQVRHVKRGAEPVNKLREALRSFIEKPVIEARKRIDRTWGVTETKERKVEKDHSNSTGAVNRAEETSPRGRGGIGVEPDEAKKIIEELLQDLSIDPETEPLKVDQVKEQIETNPITLVDTSWPGKELLDISHLNGKAIVRVNNRHPFINEIYKPIKIAANTDSSTIDPVALVQLARKVEGAIDVLFMAYAKAENMHSKPEESYSELRSYWGQFTAAYVRELLRDI